MIDFNWLIFLIITLATAIPWLLLIRKQSTLVKLPITMAMVSMYVYSGFGLAWVINGDQYVINYCLYILMFSATYIFVFAKDGRYLKLHPEIEYKESKLTNDLYSYEKFYLICTSILFLCYLVYLVLPENRLVDLVKPSMPSLPTKLARVKMYNAISLFSIIDVLITFLTPFFLLYIQCKLRDDKKKTSIILIFIWIYLDYSRFSYLGRNELVFYMVFVFFAILNYQKEQITIKKKYIFLASIIIIMIIPFLYSYTFTRQGNSIQEPMSFLKSLIGLIQTETYYPQYYGVVINHNGIIRPIDFILWIICMPIPSILWPGKPSLVVNDVFTTIVTGLSRGQLGYSVELPSILGEALLVFGDVGYIIHAIIISGIIAVIFKLYLKHKPMRILYIYYASLLLIIGRGGTGSYLPELINGSISVILWLALLNIWKRRYHE